jgi:hypothetical protein
MRQLKEELSKEKHRLKILLPKHDVLLHKIFFAYQFYSNIFCEVDLSKYKLKLSKELQLKKDKACIQAKQKGAQKGQR